MYGDSNVGNVITGVSAGGGLITAITNNATLISISLTALGIATGICFSYLAMRDRRKQMKHSQSELRAKLKAELKAEILKEMRTISPKTTS